ncbi:hypothetical protein FRX97_11145 [Luteibaculum oceani]|uniref:Uncharacterized protein n=1 Tax=Luteibaculum oceani TaxID=1294296 RepID=A0A5C6USC4_9FLAO|nr:hypothetical protein FRX97_11145 [Luteibaculum oceani]
MNHKTKAYIPCYYCDTENHCGVKKVYGKVPCYVNNRIVFIGFINAFYQTSRYEIQNHAKEKNSNVNYKGGQKLSRIPLGAR